MTARGQEEYPRTVYNEAGSYTIERAGSYDVASPSIERFAAITYMRRDLERAHEMIAACCNDELDDQDSLIAQSLWIGAIVMYGKVFKRSDARPGFNATPFR